jgi:hypothetical protein
MELASRLIGSVEDRRRSISSWMKAQRRRFLDRPSTSEEVGSFLRMLKPAAIADPMMRVGAEFDGGYVIPELLEGIACCFSPGVGQMSDFELGVANRSIPVFMADDSVDKPAAEHPQFHFEKKRLGLADDGHTMKLESWVRRNTANLKGDMLLQMDIEGAEYKVLTHANPDLLRGFRIISIEFHWFDQIQTIKGLRKLQKLFGKILRDFDVVHIHPNNFQDAVSITGLMVYPVLEFTFLRKDFVKRSGAALHFPCALDRPNKPDKPDAVLPHYWW